MIVVADASPLNYLILIETINVLPPLFGRVYVPGAVVGELSHDRSPVPVKAWIAAPPDWLVVREPDRAVDPGRLGLGEAAAIALAEDLDAEILLIDERAGNRAARERGLLTVGTLGVLGRATDVGLVDLRAAVEQLLTTNFRARRELINDLLTRYGQGPI